jgi:hypothetical protein
MKQSETAARCVPAIVLCLALAGCTTERITEPQETATEQLLISTAVDQAVSRLTVALPAGSRLFVDAQFVDMAPSDHLRYPRYLIGTVRDHLARQGFRLAEERGVADVVVELRSGAQSIDHDGFLIGLPSFPLPVPLAGTATLPEVALYKRDRRTGIAKVALTLLNRADGSLAAPGELAFGRVDRTGWTAMLFFSWEDSDLPPVAQRR